MTRKVSGTKEWSASSENIQLGCSHGCRYCYAKASAIRFGRATPEGWTEEQIDPDKVAKNFGKRKGTIMFPTTHDITPANVADVTTVLTKMLEPGNKVLVVSKPHLECIEHLCKALDEFKDQVLFRFTIGSPNDAVLSLWEPGAPNFKERLRSLKHAYNEGFQTSVSMEPLLDHSEDGIVRVVKLTRGYVTDAVWLGKANKLEERLKRNGEWDDPRIQRAALALLASQTDERILALYEKLKDHPQVKWKESIKTVVGLEVPTEAGLDI